MFPIVKKRVLNETVTLMEIEAPLVARKALPGQFIIFRIDEEGERIPLTIAGYDREKGTVTIIFQKVGYTTMKLDTLNEGDALLDFVGPLGEPSHTEGVKRAAVIGPNGAGKTTLFKMIMGMESIDKGTFEVGETVQVGYADQTHKDIDPKKTVYQVVSGGQEFIRMGGKEVNARAYLSKFNFAGADQEKLCGVLSGGERNRLHLALTLKADANVLLLDEPTNDIDVNTLRALEEGLENFAGCAVVVSHDRWFLDRICTHILSFEGDSNVVFYEGTYSEYEEYKRKTLGDAEPKRVRYRKLIVD